MKLPEIKVEDRVRLRDTEWRGRVSRRHSDDTYTVQWDIGGAFGNYPRECLIKLKPKTKPVQSLLTPALEAYIRKEKGSQELYRHLLDELDRVRQEYADFAKGLRSLCPRGCIVKGTFGRVPCLLCIHLLKTLKL